MDQLSPKVSKISKKISKKNWENKLGYVMNWLLRNFYLIWTFKILENCCSNTQIRNINSNHCSQFVPSFLLVHLEFSFHDKISKSIFNVIKIQNGPFSLPQNMMIWYNVRSNINSSFVLKIYSTRTAVYWLWIQNELKNNLFGQRYIETLNGRLVEKVWN